MQMLPNRVTPACPLVALVLALPAGAQTIVPLVQEGDASPGIGSVTRIDNLAISSSGSWLVEVDTDNPDTSADGVLVRDGLVFLQEGQALPEPAGAAVGSFDEMDLNGFGIGAWNLFLDNTSGSSDDSGVFVETILVLQEGQVSTAPGFSAGTPYTFFFEVQVNDANQVLVMATVDDPAILSSVDRALVLLTLDATGAIVSEAVIAKEGDLLPGQTELLDDMETGSSNLALNDAGDVLFIADLAGDASFDHAVYLNSTLLAQEGMSSPVAGRNWSTLSLAEVDLNDAGSWVLGAQLDGDSADNEVLVKDGAVFRREGDVLDAVAPDAIDNFGAGPVQLTEAGNVLWFGALEGTPSNSETLWIDDVLLARTGITQIGGKTLVDISNIQNGYAVSPNGRFVIFEGTLDDGTEGVYQVLLGPGVAVERNGSGVNPSCFTNLGAPNLGQDWSTTVDGSVLPGATLTAILAYDSSLPGVPTTFGELLVAPEALGGVLLASDIVVGGGLNAHAVALPSDPSNVGLFAATQALVFGGGIQLCNALDLTLGF